MISIRKYQPEDQTQWDAFVQTSNNGTLFSMRDFLNYHIDRNFEDHSLIIEKNSNIIALFPASVIKENKKQILFSHPGASFGGFILNRISYSDSEAVIQAFERYCRQLEFNSTFFVPAPSVYSEYCDDTFEYALSWRHFQIAENYISSIIEIEENLETQLAAIYRNKNRSQTYFQNIIDENQIRLEWNTDFDSFYPILVENKKKHDSKPTHTLEELIKLQRIFPDHFHLLMMYKGDQAVGGTLNFVANDRLAIIFYNMIDYKFSDLQPATIQVIETIKWAKQMGFRMLDFGVSQDPKAENPLTPSKPLIRFKEELTSRSVIRKAFVKEFS